MNVSSYYFKSQFVNFSLAALACLYILEVQKPDSDNSVASAQGPDFGSSTSAETVLPTVTTRGTLQPVVTTDATSLSTAATSTMRNNAAVTSGSTESSGKTFIILKFSCFLIYSQFSDCSQVTQSSVSTYSE